MRVNHRMDGSLTRASVRALTEQDETAWDEFVTKSPEGTFFHLARWGRVIEDVFGHKTFYYLAERAGCITGVLPLTYIKSRLFGDRLVSNAFSMYGGAIGDDEESHGALESAAVQLMGTLGAPALEFRSITPRQAGWVTRSDLYVTFRKTLFAEADANLKAIPRKERAEVRKALRYPLRSEIDEDIDRLYAVYSESVRNLGTPVFPKSYFTVLKKAFPEACDIVTVTKAGKAIASVMNMYFRDEVMPLYGGGIGGAGSLSANVFLYWEVMRRACERGYRVFDFGRSKVGTGAYAFKSNMGFQATPLAYQFKLAEGQELPEINPLNPKYQLLIAGWKRLPLSVANLLGPPIAKGLG
ncbi:MAG: FemAB family PEP-CTERM system-associated protein [Acidobacteria bacterium]|nr:FemAB family PEP-CTERM system-associated protein [Acidobacteriota bacterium]